ncbi:dihydrodipicolinate synthase family protein [Nocardia macrotermitis]|uniref:dihydrodipicolinate synthase family protein n=1 Tax=Nocardia macrotermitis TaxID=2585198 RepID=UPI001886490D|nr:dihydrodipicolinate synthase family protein [Nocardia macrotermitis]
MSGIRIGSPIVALLTPFRDGGAIDHAALGDYPDMVSAAGVETVLLYSFPRHTQTAVSPEAVARLAAKFPLVCGVKDSGKDLTISRGYKQRTPRLQVFLGDDRSGVRVRELGVDGVVTGANRIGSVGDDEIHDRAGEFTQAAVEYLGSVGIPVREFACVAGESAFAHPGTDNGLSGIDPHGGHRDRIVEIRDPQRCSLRLVA